MNDNIQEKNHDLSHIVRAIGSESQTLGHDDYLANAMLFIIGKCI